MSRNINQIYTDNPLTSLNTSDLLYVGQSPYGVLNDAAVTFQFLQKNLFSNNTLVSARISVWVYVLNYL